VHVPFYAIYEVEKAAVTVYELVAGRYQLCQPNDRGHYAIGPLGVELGIWRGRYMNREIAADGGGAGRSVGGEVAGVGG
jgi:Uma2 family endonuclease